MIYSIEIPNYNITTSNMDILDYSNEPALSQFPPVAPLTMIIPDLGAPSYDEDMAEQRR